MKMDRRDLVYPLEKMCLIVPGYWEDFPGAFSKDKKTSEFRLNSELALSIQGEVNTADVQLVYRDCSYKDLPDKVNKFKITHTKRNETVVAEFIQK